MRYPELSAPRVAGSRPATHVRPRRGRLATAVGFRRTLARSYACTLVEIEGPSAPEAEACPEAGEPMW